MNMCVVSNEGVIKYYLDPLDITKKADGTPSDFTGIDEQMMIEVSVKNTKRYFGTYEPL